jgi:hypothetical protein
MPASRPILRTIRIAIVLMVLVIAGFYCGYAAQLLSHMDYGSRSSWRPGNDTSRASNYIALWGVLNIPTIIASEGISLPWRCGAFLLGFASWAAYRALHLDGTESWLFVSLHALGNLAYIAILPFIWYENGLRRRRTWSGPER